MRELEAIERIGIHSNFGPVNTRLEAAMIERLFGGRGGCLAVANATIGLMLAVRNLHKRYLIHVAGYNLGLIMRLLTGAGTPREFQARAPAHLAAAVTPTGGLLLLLIVAADDQTAALALSIEPDLRG